MKYKLPPLPEHIFIPSGLGFTKDDMQAYAIAAIEAQGVPMVADFDQLQAMQAEWHAVSHDNSITSEAKFQRVYKAATLASAPPAPQAESNLTAMVRIADQIKKYGPVEPRQARKASADFDLPAPNDNINVEQASVGQQEPCGRLEADEFEGHVFVPRIAGDWSMLNKYLYTHPAQQAKSPEWYAIWIRNNYQDHPNIQSLCDALIAAANAP